MGGYVFDALLIGGGPFGHGGRQVQGVPHRLIHSQPSLGDARTVGGGGQEKETEDGGEHGRGSICKLLPGTGLSRGDR